MLPGEAAERRAIVDAVLRSFGRWGYGPVESPVVEESATLDAASAGSAGRGSFRLVDRDGTLLALRPEMTLPIARLAASRLSGEPLPLRLCYAAPVFRERESLRGDARQFTQLGTELIGADGPLADAEVVGAMIEALEAASIPDFAVGVGTVRILFELLDASGADDVWRGAYMAAAHSRNLVAIDALCADGSAMPAAARALRAVPRIADGADAIAQCRRECADAGVGSSLDDLEQTLGILEAAGMASRVRVDFGILRSFDYYTGLVLEAYAPGIGVPLGGGGRYDDTLAGFGWPQPAAGFALSLDRVHIALTEQAAAPVLEPEGAAVSAGTSAERFVEAARLRRGGGAARLDLAGPGGERT